MIRRIRSMLSGQRARAFSSTRTYTHATGSRKLIKSTRIHAHTHVQWRYTHACCSRTCVHQRIRMRVTHTAGLHSRFWRAHVLKARIHVCVRTWVYATRSSHGHALRNQHQRQSHAEVQNERQSAANTAAFREPEILARPPYLFLRFSDSFPPSYTILSLSLFLRLVTSLFLFLFLCLRALPLLAGLCLLPFTVSTLPRIEDTGICTVHTSHARLRAGRSVAVFSTRHSGIH